MNPYHYGTPVDGDRFTGREEEVASLVRRMRDGVNVVVVSPRRYGKTSLLRKAAGVLAEDGAAAVTVNVLGCRDAGAFAARLATAAYRLRVGRWHRTRQAVPEFLRRLRVTPTVTFDGDRPTFGFDPRLADRDVDMVISDVYGLLADFPPHRPAVLILDEFQAITDLGAHLPGLFKGLADSHPAVSLVVAGSHRHLMDQLVSAPTAPLYGMAERIALDTLPAPVMVDYLRRRAYRGGKPMTADAAERIFQLAGPVPNDVQHLAYETFAVATDAITPAEVEVGMSRAVAHESAIYADRLETLAPGQRRILAELAIRPAGEPYSAEFTRRVGLANSASVRKALAALVAAEMVVRRHGVYQVSDPFFACWLRADD